MKPFREEATQKADFHVDESTKVTVDMMNAKDEQYGVYISKNITLIKLPYHGNVSMAIVLPSKGKMEEVEKDITREQLEDWIYKAHQR